MSTLAITDLAGLEPGRIFYSGRLYVVEAKGTASMARPWESQPGSLQGIVALSRKSTLASRHPVIERAMVLPVLRRGDFFVDGQPTAYTLETEKDARLAAQLDKDLTLKAGLSLQRLNRVAAWVLTDGGNPHRLYHYKMSPETDAQYAAYCANHHCLRRNWPDEHTQHWKLLFGL